ncbi:hypothetical protein KR100_03700 [Synechococcus sp. KORDI-100]|nr:hypothetical protein KR100_03700 [Synechococcus sp. KORDI-100]
MGRILPVFNLFKRSLILISSSNLLIPWIHQLLGWR